ncbi:MAG: hypothetical protein Q7T51_03925 [Candidatus Moranbacteria bacterium]|nr:hypothetical protein [Candidatus Moranbacteria bacterium]
MFKKIATLEIDGCGLIFSRIVLDRVILLASGMLLRRSGKGEIRNDSCQGMLSTIFQKMPMGGTEFNLELEIQGKVTTSKLGLIRVATREELGSYIWAESCSMENSNRKSYALIWDRR